MRSSAVEDTTTVDYKLQSKMNKTCIYLLFWHNVTARIYYPGHISCHVRISKARKNMAVWHTTKVQRLMNRLVRTQLFFFSLAVFPHFFQTLSTVTHVQTSLSKLTIICCNPIEYVVIKLRCLRIPFTELLKYKTFSIYLCL